MKQHTQNNFLSYLIILWALFVLVFFTKNIFEQVQQQSDELEVQNGELINQRSELTQLRNLQQELASEESEADKEIIGFSWEFSDENIINHIYGYAQEVNLWEERIIIREVSLTAGEKSDTWFNKANISLDIITSSEETLFSFMNYLTSGDSEFRFYITNFNYDFWSSDGNISINIPLTFYYK